MLLNATWDLGLERLGISQLAEQLLASQVGLCPSELVS